MAQKNRANMLTDIVNNIYNNLINFITGQNAQDRFVNLLDSSPNILSDASQANGYVSTDANNEMFSSYYDEEISRADLISDLTANLAVGGKFYRINDAVGSTITLLVIAESNINLYSIGTDITTGEQGTYDITTDVFTPIVVSGTPDLQQVTTAGATTSVGVTVDNGAGESIDIKHDLINITNALGTATITSPTLTTATEFRIPDKVTGPQTFAMLTDITGGGGTVTSVGLSMPSAFSVASSPVTTSGTIAVTGAGLSSQYVRGDGSLANFPSSGGGGASLNYYLNGSVAQGTLDGVAFKQMSSTPVIGTGTDFSINADGYIQSFITDASVPNQLLIPAGNWNFEMYFSANSNGGSPRFYIELYKLSAGTLSLIASSSATPEYITNGTNIDLYTTAVAVPSTVLLAADRLAIRVYVIHSSKIITLHTENSHLCQVITTFTTGLTALNGLTEQVQTFAVGTTGTDFAISSASGIHNFNLPTASATNRGALSSADWSAFNAKVTSFASGADGTASSGTSNTISISVLIPANTFVVDDVIRINHRVRATGTAAIRETRVYANTSASLTGATLISTASLTSTILSANLQRFLAIKNVTTNTEVITATASQLTDYNNLTTAVSTLLINWTVDQYIIFAVNAGNAADSIRASMYSIEKL